MSSALLGIVPPDGWLCATTISSAPGLQRLAEDRPRVDLRRSVLVIDGDENRLRKRPSSGSTDTRSSRALRQSREEERGGGREGG